MSTEPGSDSYDDTRQEGSDAAHRHGCTDCPEHHGSGNCDPGLIDDLICRTKGIAAQAEYNAAAQPALEQAGKDYDAARTAYRAARSAAALQLQDLRHTVRQLIERIRCQIKQDDVVECLDRAYQRICRQLDECQGPGGCCASTDCEFDDSCLDSYDELVSRLAEYQARLERDKECFSTLIGEPAALTARVAAVNAKIAAITAELAGDQAAVDLKKLYVAARVAKRHLDLVWNGFEHTSDFIDCLCRALTCWTKASAVVSILLGHKAVKDCKREASQKHCDELAANTVEEVLQEYERISGKPDCSDGDDGDDGCGCGHDHGDRGDDDDDVDGGDDVAGGDDVDGGDDLDAGDDEDCDCGHGGPHRRRDHGRSRS